ncbi:MAG TPA: excinuclease ABC subunit A, partial [Pusillimonas sp.]|nr:excinuclease ABC subunit A [Pusillimonas sp.]
MTSPIRIFGARQNNLKNLDVTIQNGELLVLTGVSGSGKSSLAFDTLYAEGQRRYVETFSPYARQFLDRMDKPQVDRIEGILPAIAIDQVNPVRNSRSTVGTMTELNDHLKLLFARMGRLFCRCCGQEVRRDDPSSIQQALAERTREHDPRLVVTFPVSVPASFNEDEIRGFLEQQGYTRIHHQETVSHNIGAAPDKKSKAKGRKPAMTEEQSRLQLHVVQDRFRFSNAEGGRVMEAIDTALKQGGGYVTVYASAGPDEPETAWRFSNRLHCAQCNIDYARPLPSSFSFNSPLGACEHCRGFGRVMGIDFGLVVPDQTKTLREGAIKPWQTNSYKECQQELQRYAPAAG